MTSTSHEPTDSRFLTSLTELQRNGVGRPTKAELDQGLNSLYARIASRRVRHRGLVRWSLVAAAMVVLAVVTQRVVSLNRQPISPPRTPVLAYQIEGGRVLEGGYLGETGRTGIKLLFNEGSQFLLMPGTRGRLRSVNPEGARMAIENGTASFQVSKGSARRWLVEVGPFLVTVKGTIFVVSWDPTSERFELQLRRGRVMVSGPVSGGELALRAGQRLVVSLPKGETLITEAPPDDALARAFDAPQPSATAPSGPLPSTAQVTPVEPGPSTTPSPIPLADAKVGSERGWANDLASGNWDRILEKVDRTGVDAALSGASSEDLFALADAARYRRRADLAYLALLAQRRRFPNSPRALDAVFLLGRVEESRGAGVARAIARYDEYLGRAPTGPYAAEALGRKMTLTNQSGGPAQARPIAQEYLRRFPKGSYAGSARALLRVP